MIVKRLDGDDPRAVSLVSRLFDRAGAWGVMLWDMPREERRDALHCALKGADVYVALPGGVVVACAWTRPVLPGTRVGMAHFCGVTRRETLEAGRLFLAGPALKERYDALLGLIPAPYRHARSLARELGFDERLIPGLCRLADTGRLTDGALLTRDLRGEDA